MAIDLHIRCDCGAFQAVVRGVAPDRGNHCVCYCDDCQLFQHYLGEPDRVLDAHGGTGIFQLSSARVEITSGGEHLACVRLGPKGPLRWFASCCDAAVGNTLPTASLPFVGLITPCVRRANDAAVVAEALGPLRGGVFGRYAYGDGTAVDAHDKVPLSLVLRFLRLAAGWRLRGDRRRSPFFDAVTGSPVVTPKILAAAEREDLECRRQAFAEARRGAQGSEGGAVGSG